MSILSGFFKTKKYRKTDDGYKLQSEWTSSETVEMGDGNTVEENLGAIQGITSSLASTSDNYALSASAGKDLQDQVTDLNSSLPKYTEDNLPLAITPGFIALGYESAYALTSVAIPVNDNMIHGDIANYIVLVSKVFQTDAVGLSANLSVAYDTDSFVIRATNGQGNFVAGDSIVCRYIVFGAKAQ